MTKKKNEMVFETPQQEIAFLKKQSAGLKGNCKAISKERDDLNKCVSQLLDEKSRLEKINQGLESQVNNMAKKLKETQEKLDCVKGEKARIEANCEYYTSLPWWKKLFS